MIEEPGAAPTADETAKKANFFWRTRLDYGSCAPYRVPPARLATTQATVSTDKESTPADPQSVEV
jgi:hypothetical protein